MNPRILLLSAYDAASHRRWRNQLVAMCPDYHWQTLTLPPRFFQWRIRGNPVSWLAEPCLSQPWDLIIATSMVDLATLRGLHPQLVTTPCLLYMHENQFAFPVSEQQQGRLEPQMVNLYSALAADAVAFNSAWNRDSFLRGVDALLDKMPDAVPPGVVQALTEKSRVLPVPIEDRLFVDQGRALNWRCPHLLWNHRWEYDKGPDRLLAFLQALAGRSMPFRLSVVGRASAVIRRHLTGSTSNLPVTSSTGVLWTVAMSTTGCCARQTLFCPQPCTTWGLAVLEAMASGCVALVPDRLAYREYVPEPCRYRSDESSPEAEARAAVSCLEQIMMDKPASASPDAWRASRLAGRYRALLGDLIAGR